MANPEHLAILKQGVETWNKWRQKSPDIQPDLREADLLNANLFGADLHNALLQGANFYQGLLQRANLSGANIDNGHLREADLIHANLNLASLSEANLTEARLFQANLKSSNLQKAEMYKCILQKADLSNAILLETNLWAAVIPEAKLVQSDMRGANLWEADLSHSSLMMSNLEGADLHGSKLYRANFTHANLTGCNLWKSDLTEANLENCTLAGADLTEAKIYAAKLVRADLEGAKLGGANLCRADLREACLRKATLFAANLIETNACNCDFSNADLSWSQLVQAQFNNSNLSNCRVFGVSAWELQMEGANQLNLLISKHVDPDITVDHLEVAQFIYLLLSRKKLRDVIDTITSKSVLILGRFTPERKAVLDAIANELRKHNLVPIIFDFERASSRDFTETIKTLAGMSLFVIADITNPSSAPLELQATVPDYQIPFIPIIQEDENPFSMFQDLKQKYGEWVLDPLAYDTAQSLLDVFDEAVLAPAKELARKLELKKAEQVRTRHVKDFKKA